jgi:hypothetical protein
MKRVLILLLAASMTLPLYPAELVRDGQPLAEIVIPTNPVPSVKTAASELQKYLKKMSGAELPIVSKATGKTPVYVGASEYTDRLGIRIDDIKDDGFKIIVKDDFVALLGRDQHRLPIPRNNTKFGISETLNKEWEAYTGHRWEYPRIIRDPRNFCPEVGFCYQDATGTLYAVYDFLESLGMRWFMPLEEIGQVIPELKNIRVPATYLKKEPQFAARTLMLCGVGSETQTLWLKYLKQGGMFDHYPAHSSTSVSKFQQDRPELLAHSGGKPISCGPKEYLPKLSSPQLREELAEHLIKIADTFPELPYMPIGQPDGWVMMDEQDAAAGWDKTAEGDWGKFSDYTWDFVLDVANKVRKQRPNTKFSTFSYGYAKNPPKTIDKIPGDIAIYFTQNSTMWQMPSLEPALREEWIRKAPDSDFFIYDYYLFHTKNNPPVPAIFTSLMEKNFKPLYGHCKGIYTEIAYSPSFKNKYNIRFGLPGINHIMLYLHSKLTWDSNLDVKAVLRDYYEKFYGPAKTEMQEFFEYSEKIWMRPDARQISAVSGFLKPDDVPKYFEILGRAKAKAGDSIYGKRIDFIAEEIEPMKKLFSELKRTGPDIRVRRMEIPLEIDGDLSKPFWTQHYQQEISWFKNITTGVAPEINSTSAAFRWLPDSSLAIGITCHEKQMDSLNAKTPASVKDEMSIYNDDNIEVYLETPEGYSAKIVVNPNGSVLDTCTTPNAADVPGSWNIEKAAVRKLPDRWTVELKIKGIGNMPTKAYPWGVNVCRQRLAGGKFEGYAISPTGGGFNAPTKMGNLSVRK